jgi:hypothetical protein
MTGLEVGHGEKSDHQSDDDTERDFHGANLPLIACCEKACAIVTR